MTTLNNETKRVIASEAARSGFVKKADDIKALEHKIGMRLYNKAFDKKTRDAAAAMPEKWMRMDGCLRFNCNGYDLRLSVNSPVPVPYATNCSRLASFAADECQDAIDLSEKKEKLRAEHRDAEIKVRALLDSVRTFKRLKEIWPEGLPFYKKYMDETGANLPAVNVSDLNKILGLKQGKAA